MSTPLLTTLGVQCIIFNGWLYSRRVSLSLLPINASMVVDRLPTHTVSGVRPHLSKVFFSYLRQTDGRTDSKMEIFQRLCLSFFASLVKSHSGYLWRLLSPYIFIITFGQLRSRVDYLQEWPHFFVWVYFESNHLLKNVGTWTGTRKNLNKH